MSIAYHDGDESVLTEASDHKLKDDEVLRWWLDGGTLYVKYAASGYRGMDMLGKQLTLLLPESVVLDKATISVVSADVRTDAITADTISLQTVSGSVDAAVRTAERLSISAVSGAVRVDADQLNVLEADTVSGALVLEFANAPEKLQAGAVSGDVTIRLPESAGFTADVKSVSGSVSGTLPMEREGEDRYVGGDGQCRISVDTVSGDVRLDKVSR